MTGRQAAEPTIALLGVQQLPVCRMPTTGMAQSIRSPKGQRRERFFEPEYAAFAALALR
jgi:hypothetical protein